MMQVIRRGVSSLAKAGSAKLTGDVTLTGGANVTLTQSGNDISIAAAAGGSTGDLAITQQTLTGNLTVATGTNAITAGELNLGAYDVLLEGTAELFIL